MASPEGTPVPILVERSSADPATPLLLTGLAAAVVLAANGEIACPRETRGGIVEWGGAYGQGVRLTGPWRVSGRVGEASFELGPTLQHLEATRASLTSRHAWGPVDVTQELYVLPREPGVVRRLRFAASAPTRLRVSHEVQPFLAPILVEGIKPYEYKVERRGPTLLLSCHGFGLGIDTNVPDTAWSVGGKPMPRLPFDGEVGPLTATQTFELTPGQPTVAEWVIWGGLARTTSKFPQLGVQALGRSGSWASEADGTWAEWLARTPQLELPDDPELERAYGLAVSALRTLYTAPDPDTTGLVAGYPWYADLWCRDLAWMLPAVVWVGDWEWAEASVRTVMRYQSPERIPLLGATIGELPMQVSPGPVFLFGTSDTTLYYPDLVRRLCAHAGDVGLARDLGPGLQGIRRWIDGKRDSRTGLFTNGGEVEEIRDATARVGTTHYGFDAVDTTIWDSTDRRDHAIDLQVLLYQALDALADMAAGTGDVVAAAEHRAHADVVARGLPTSYRWPEEGYLYDSLRRDGTPVDKLRPNALRAVSAGLVSAEVGRGLVERASRTDLTTPWGLRTLSSADPAYDPQAYHDGQVWSIATTWAADAAFAIGERALGVQFLRANGDRIVRENGLANECYRGDRDEAFDSCFLLGFSIAPFLTTIFERLWGLTIRYHEGLLKIDPGFPAGWSRATLRRLRVGGGWVDLQWSPGSVAIRWTGPGPLRVVGRSSELTVPPGGAGELTVPRS